MEALELNWRSSGHLIDDAATHVGIKRNRVHIDGEVVRVHNLYDATGYAIDLTHPDNLLKHEGGLTFILTCKAVIGYSYRRIESPCDSRNCLNGLRPFIRRWRGHGGRNRITQ